jgi:glutamyl-tRNA synthetase
VPLIISQSGKKLSKRRDPVSIEHYQAEGYLAFALINWLVRLGWSHGDQEIFSRDEIVELFDLEPIGRSAAQADLDKLLWLDQHYLKELPMDELFAGVAPYLEQNAGRPIARDAGLEALLDLLRERSKTLVEMAARAAWLVSDEIEIEAGAAKKHLKAAARPLLQRLHECMSEATSWDEASLEAIFNAVAAENDDIKLGKLAQPVRVAVTGGPVSPGIYETLTALGRDRSLERISRAIALIDERVAAAQ